VECGVNTEVVFVPTPFNIHEIPDAIDMLILWVLKAFIPAKQCGLVF